MNTSTKQTENLVECGNKSKPLLYDGIFAGMRVKDNDGDIGTIDKIEDIYNISVKYDNGGVGYTCLNGCCNDVLYAVT